MSILDDKVRRNLRVMFQTNAFGGRAPGSLNTPAHQATARQVAEEAIVLLKNDGLLPFAEAPQRIAVVGPLADNSRRAGASGCPSYHRRSRSSPSQRKTE